MNENENLSPIGKTATATVTVNDTNSAIAMGSGLLPVFATPAMVALMEQAACEVLREIIHEGKTTVGTAIDVTHSAASPIGAEIITTAKLLKIDGRRYDFEIVACDNSGEIGRASLSRVEVDVEKFMKKAEERGK